MELYKKEIADIKLNTSRQTQIKLTCPVFKKECFEGCASFNIGKVRSLGIYDFNYKAAKEKSDPETPEEMLEIWSMYPASCLNAIVNGYIECDMCQ